MNGLKYLFGALFLIVSLSAFSQSITVKKETWLLKGDDAQGYSTDMEGSKEEIDLALNKFLKSLGKAKPFDNALMLPEFQINGKPFFRPLYALTQRHGVFVQVWMGILPTEWSEPEKEKIDKEIEALVRGFAVKFYRDKIQVQIDETQRALTAVEKQRQRLGNQEKELQSNLENNKKEKARLEKALVDNAEGHKALLRKIEGNKKGQDSVSVASEQIKKILEMQKDKQKKVN